MTPRIIFYCGRTVESWSPLSINRGGIGGSETAVIKIAERFARDGWRADVYCSAGPDEGEVDGVGYWEPSRLGRGETADVLVSWRNPALDVPVTAKARLLWLHDVNSGPDVAAAMRRWDRVLGVSQNHADHLARLYDLDNTDFVPNGISLERFDPTIRKVPFSAIYASSLDRGLMTLLDLWPRIAGDEPTALLTVAYGTAGIDAMIRAGRTDYLPFRAQVLAKIEATPRVEYVGRLPQDELARRYSQTVIWPYPTSYWETSCISAMEAMAGGCIPVCSSVGALKETVADGGLVVYGPGKTRSSPDSPAWRDFFVRCAQGAMFERTSRVVLEAKARQRARAFTWDASYERWKRIVTGLLEGDATTDRSRCAERSISTRPEGELVAAG